MTDDEPDVVNLSDGVADLDSTGYSSEIRSSATTARERVDILKTLESGGVSGPQSEAQPTLSEAYRDILDLWVAVTIIKNGLGSMLESAQSEEAALDELLDDAGAETTETAVQKGGLDDEALDEIRSVLELDGDDLDGTGPQSSDDANPEGK